jgi:hypothetical protein
MLTSTRSGFRLEQMRQTLERKDPQGGGCGPQSPEANIPEAQHRGGTLTS